MCPECGPSQQARCWASSVECPAGLCGGAIGYIPTRAWGCCSGVGRQPQAFGRGPGCWAGPAIFQGRGWLVFKPLWPNWTLTPLDGDLLREKDGAGGTRKPQWGLSTCLQACEPRCALLLGAECRSGARWGECTALHTSCQALACALRASVAARKGLLSVQEEAEVVLRREEWQCLSSPRALAVRASELRKGNPTEQRV